MSSTPLWTIKETKTYHVCESEEELKSLSMKVRAAAMAHKRDREELPHVQGQGQRLRVPGCNGAGTAKRSYPMSEVRGCSGEELPHVRGQGQWPRRATRCPRSGAAAGRSYPTMTLLLLLLLLSRFSPVRLFVTPETAAHQAPLSLGFSRQEQWSGLPFPSPMYESEK